MDAYSKPELPSWDFGMPGVEHAMPYSAAPVPYEPDRAFVIDDPMVTADSVLRMRSVLFNGPMALPLDTSYPSLFPTDDAFVHEAPPSSGIFMEAPGAYNHGRDAMDVALEGDYESDTSSAVNTPREGFSLPQVAHGQFLGQEQDLTPREGQEALIKTAFEKARVKRVKGYGLYRCPLASCQRTYRRKGDLKVHCKKKHPDRLDLPDMISKPRSTRQGKTFLCPEPGCPCGFMRQRGLLRHYRKKHPEKANDPVALFYISGLGDEPFEETTPAARMSERVKSIRAAMARSSFSAGSSNSDDNSAENELRFTAAGSEEDDDELYEESS